MKTFSGVIAFVGIWFMVIMVAVGLVSQIHPIVGIVTVLALGIRIGLGD